MLQRSASKDTLATASWYLCGSLLGNLSHTHGNFCTANSYSSKVTVAARAMKDLLASPGLAES